MERRYVQQLERAIRNDWPIPADVRERAVLEMDEILKNSKSKRAKILAVKTLLAADAINAKREANDQRSDWWQVKSETNNGSGDINITGNVNILNADGERAGLAALRERLGIGQGSISEGHANGHGSVDSGANGKTPHKQNGGPNGHAAPPDGETG